MNSPECLHKYFPAGNFQPNDREHRSGIVFPIYEVPVLFDLEQSTPILMLCWRFHLAGLRVLSVPGSVVYHHGAFSLKADSFRKTYLNHRNQLVLILKNWSFLNLFWAFPARVLLLSATLFLPLIKGNWKHPLAAIAGLLWVFTHPLNIWLRRREARRSLAVSDAEVLRKMYRGSIVYQHYVRGVRTVAQLWAGEVV